MEQLVNIFKAIGIDYYHTPAPANAALPYIALTDYAESYFKADDRIDEVTEHIQADYYTKAEFDPNKNAIRNALDEAGIDFTYRCLYENGEDVYHHIFDCSCAE